MSPSASLTFVGTATTVLRLGGFTLLTDPNFLHRGQRAYLGKGLWTKRLTEPALQPTQLPALDSILLSHLHADHWDRIATRTLDRDTPVITTQAAARAPARARARGASARGTSARRRGSSRARARPPLARSGPLRPASRRPRAGLSGGGPLWAADDGDSRGHPGTLAR